MNNCSSFSFKIELHEFYPTILLSVSPITMAKSLSRGNPDLRQRKRKGNVCSTYSLSSGVMGYLEPGYRKHWWHHPFKIPGKVVWNLAGTQRYKLVKHYFGVDLEIFMNDIKLLPLLHKLIDRLKEPASTRATKWQFVSPSVPTTNNPNWSFHKIRFADTHNLYLSHLTLI